jgi:transcription elongation factor GreA
LDLRDALDALVQLQGRISERQALLAAAEPVEEGPDGEGRIRIGARVTVRDATGELTTYVLVSPPEASPRHGRLSAACPVGRALLGARSGETVSAQTPDGAEHLVVVDVA